MSPLNDIEKITYFSVWGTLFIEREHLRIAMRLKYDHKCKYFKFCLMSVEIIEVMELI